MNPENEEVPVSGGVAGQADSLNVKESVQPEEHAAYIAAVAENATAQEQQPAVIAAQPIEAAHVPSPAPVEPVAMAVTDQTIPHSDPQPQSQPATQPHSFITGLRKMPRKKKLVLAGVALLVVVIGVLALTRLLSEGTVASLTPDSKNGIAFDRPSNWQQTKEEDGLVYYTENGSEASDMNRGMILGVQTLGVRYSTLGEEDRANIRKSFESEFSRSEALSGDQCEQITNVKTTELTKEGYDLAFKVDAECPQLKDGKTGGKIKMFIGWNDVDLHVVGVVADSPTWEAEGSELEAIANSVRPE